MRLVTHSGKIHSDETVAIALLSNYFANKGIEVSVLRTRDSDKFLHSDILIDVGGEYNHEQLKYDHHQPGFSEVWENYNIPLSSAGLIWRHYGKEIVEMYLSTNAEQYDHSFNYSEITIEELVNMIYGKLILDIDANENGIVLKNNTLNIAEIVSAVNSKDENLQNINFNRAVALVGNIFDIKFREIINGYFNFQRDLEIVKTLDLSEEYLVLKENIPTIFKCLGEIDPSNHIKFCIFFNEKECTIKARRINENKFLPICPILCDESISDVIFVHKASFIAKTKTLSAAIELVKKSLAARDIEKEENLEVREGNSVIQVEKVLLQDKRIVAGLAIGGIAAFSYFYFNNNES